MAKAKNINQLEQLAKEYGTADNPIVQELIDKYYEQKKLIDKMQKTIETDGLICMKEYVKSRENMVANPLLGLINKYHETSNKTLDALTNAIIKFGSAPQKKNRLREMMTEDDG